MGSSLHLRIGAGLDIEDNLALNESQKEKLHQFQLEMKLRNEKYIRDHPELQILIKIFLEEVFIKQPENLRQFASDFFTRPDLRQKVQLLTPEHYPPPPEPEIETESELSEDIDLISQEEKYPWDEEESLHTGISLTEPKHGGEERKLTITEIPEAKFFD